MSNFIKVYDEILLELVSISLSVGCGKITYCINYKNHSMQWQVDADKYSSQDLMMDTIRFFKVLIEKSRTEQERTHPCEL